MPPPESELDSVISKIKKAHLSEPSFAAECQDQIGDYLIHQPLGVGGMGTVFQATHSHLDKTVALKVLPHRKMQNSEAISRFRREMKIVGQLDHPSIVQATDAGQVHGTHYLAMEYVDGLDLGLLIKHSKNLSDGSCCELISQAAKGIAYVHSQGVIHRDIKPSNLMLTREGHVKILDLGLAMLSGINGIVDELTTVGQLMGTIDYMAPEQYGDSHLIDQRADVYALGATLYKLLTRQAPFDSKEKESPLQKLKRIATEFPVSVLDRRPDLDPALAKVISKAISREPDDRFQTADELAEALQGFCCSKKISGELTEATDSLQQFIQDQKESEEARLDAIGVKNPYEDSVEKEISLLAEKVQQLETRSESGTGRRSRYWWKIALAGFFVAGALLCGILIQIEMDKGRLVIESESDNVKVTLLKDGKVYDKMELEQGTNSTRIRAGKYEVVIEGGSDKLVIDQNQFKLTRGETIVAKIRQELTPTNTRQPNVEPAGAKATSEPVYQGLNLAQWLEKTKADIFNSDKVGEMLPIETAPIRKLSGLGPQIEIDKAARFWANVIENETSLDQLYRLVPLIDALANTKENAELLTDRFLMTLFKNYDSSKRYFYTLKLNGSSQTRSKTPMWGLFSRWGTQNRSLIEQKLFARNYDKTDKSEEARMAFLAGLDFSTNSKSFSATHENILNLLKMLTEGNFENRVKLSDWVVSLTYAPEKLSSETKVELKSKLQILAHQAQTPFKEFAIRCLIDLGEKNDSLLEEIVDDLDQNPALIPLLSEFDNMDHALTKIEKLLSDEKWGWTNKFKSQPIERPVARKNSISGLAGGSGMMMGSGTMSHNGTVMSGGMFGGSGEGHSGNLSALEKQKLMNRPDYAEMANLRFELVLELGKLEDKAKLLLPVLRSQQKLTSNQDYLAAVWSTYEQIQPNGMPRLYAGKELDVWNSELALAKRDGDFAIAMIAVASLIGDLDFDNRLDHRTTLRNRGNRQVSFKEIEGRFIKNKDQYVRFMQSLLPRLRQLSFDDFDSSEDKYKSCYKDPRMAAFLLGNGIALDLIRVATKKDYDYLSCLRTKSYEEIEQFRMFLRTALQTAEAGSIAQFRFVAKASQENHKLLTEILLDENSTVGTKLLIMERLLLWDQFDFRATEQFIKLIKQYPDVSLALLARMNPILVERQLDANRRFGAQSRYNPTAPALLGLNYLVEAPKLNTEKEVQVLPESRIYLDDMPLTFREEIRVKRTRVERIMDILLSGHITTTCSEAVKVLEDESSKLNTVQLIKKLNATRTEVDQVVQNKIDKFVAALTIAHQNYTVRVEKRETPPKEKK